MPPTRKNRYWLGMVHCVSDIEVKPLSKIFVSFYCIDSTVLFKDQLSNGKVLF